MSGEIRNSILTTILGPKARIPVDFASIEQELLVADKTLSWKSHINNGGE